MIPRSTSTIVNLASDGGRPAPIFDLCAGRSLARRATITGARPGRAMDRLRPSGSGCQAVYWTAGERTAEGEERQTLRVPLPKHLPYPGKIYGLPCNASPAIGCPPPLFTGSARLPG